MVALSENPIWEEFIRRVETTDLVLGGPPNTVTGEAAVNVMGTQLANRLLWLYDALAAQYTNSQIDTLIADAVGVLTAAEILTRVKTVDGAGSGLDADLLDGEHGSAYTKQAGYTLTGNASAGAISFPVASDGKRPTLQWVVGTTSSVTGYVFLALPVTFPTAILGGIANESGPTNWAANVTTVFGVDMGSSTVSGVGVHGRQINAGTVSIGPPAGLTARVLCWGY